MKKSLDDDRTRSSLGLQILSSFICRHEQYNPVYWYRWANPTVFVLNDESSKFRLDSLERISLFVYSPRCSDFLTLILKNIVNLLSIWQFIVWCLWEYIGSNILFESQFCCFRFLLLIFAVMYPFKTITSTDMTSLSQLHCSMAINCWQVESEQIESQWFYERCVWGVIARWPWS